MSGLTFERLSACPLFVFWSMTLLLQMIETEAYFQEDTKEDLENETYEIFSTSYTPPPPQSDQCICAPFYLCRNHTINTDGDGLLDVRKSNVNPCKDSKDVCCYDQKDPKPSSNILNFPYEGKRRRCGHRNPSSVIFRITSNDTAELGEFPWMTAILKLEPNQSKTYMCGGSLIHPNVVLTAVHCVNRIKDSKDLVIRTGEWDLQTENELLPSQDRQVLKIIKHDKFYGGALYNDVALIIVTQPFLLNDNVGTVCLPSQNYVFNNEKCIACGWGKNKLGQSGEYHRILKKIDLPTVPINSCLESLRKTWLGKNFKLHESFMCAGGEIGKDTCQGDGGSPLMCPLDNKPEQFHQAGIVAWGIGCGEETPGVYVDVAFFRNWIDKQMAKENLDTSFYDSDYVLSN